MKSPLHILHLEDDPDDAALVRSILEAGDIVCSITVVQDRPSFLAALEHNHIDLVLSDYALSDFDGLTALEMVRARHPDLPFILVSGVVGEEQAIESFKRGATDYVLKDRLVRLVPEVRRAMVDVEERVRRRHLEEQLIHSQKMEVVGQLAGGVAHDFNNILAVIVGYTDLILQQVTPDHPLYKYVMEIEHAVDRASKLTRQLLIFSRKQPLQPAVVNLNDILKTLDKMLQKLIDEHIELTIVPGRQLGRIKADSGYVGQVLMNLAVNARDAMPNGGRLTIETRNVHMDEEYASTHPDAAAGDYVMLSISDTGVGMSEDVKGHLFEPFFTTKPKGKGTGLGLAMCQSIVKQCGGHMNVFSESGKGTTFKIYFPQVNEPLSQPDNGQTGDPMPRGTETVLVVEDESSLRDLARCVLAGQGYEVLTATNGQDGLRVASERKGRPLHLVVSDVVMPRMGGKVMAEWLKATYPNLKVLFTSGYTDEAIAHHGVLEPGVAFLPKPYTPAGLTRKVRDLLDTPTAPAQSQPSPNVSNEKAEPSRV